MPLSGNVQSIKARNAVEEGRKLNNNWYPVVVISLRYESILSRESIFRWIVTGRIYRNLPVGALHLPEKARVPNLQQTKISKKILVSDDFSSKISPETVVRPLPYRYGYRYGTWYEKKDEKETKLGEGNQIMMTGDQANGLTFDHNLCLTFFLD
eukprot:scaffold237481_cov63-Attheya_sp.AAC.1